MIHALPASRRLGRSAPRSVAVASLAGAAPRATAYPPAITTPA
jgi:hypothetical protein